MPFPKDQDLLPAFENFDLWSAGLPENRRALVENHFKFTAPEDLEEERKHFLSVALISQRTGRDAEEVSRNLETLYIPSFSKDVRGLNMAFPPKDAGEFYQQARSKLIDEKDERETFGEGSMAAFRGDDVIPALQAWQAKNGLERMAKSTAFTKGFLGAREWAGDQLEFASNLLGQIESNTGLTKGEGEQRPKAASRESAAEFEQSLATLADMQPEDRKKVYAIIAAKAEAAGYDPKGFWAQMLSEFGKGMARAGDTVSTSGADLLAGGSMVGGDAAGGFAPVPADSQERFQQGMEKRGKRGVIFAEIENLVAGTVDPVKPVLGWMNDTVEKGLIKGPGAVAPFMAASVALGPYGAGVLFTADFAEQNRRDLVISGMDEGQARVIGMAAAPLQAFTESLSNALQLGRFPAVQKVLAGFTKPIGGGAGLITRYIQNSAISSLGTQFTEEQIQDNLIVPAIQNIVAAFDEDVPSVGMGQMWDNIKKSSPELFWTLAPMALVFGGTMTAAQANLSAVAISSQDMLEAAGFSSAQANTIRSETAPEAQIAKARELWGQRAGTAKSIEDAAKSVGERMKQLQTDHMAAQLDMERRGILPRMLRSSEDNWRLTFSDGSTADFHTHQDADAARWQWATDQLGKVHLATREALAQMEKNAAVGREFAVEFKPDAMTAKQAVEEGRASPAQIERRIAQGEAAGEVSEEETFSNAASIDKATSDYLSSLQILGSSANEFKDGVLRTTIRLYEGAHVLTLVEEKLEGDAKQILASKPGSEWMLRSLRNYEQISGDSILRKVPDSELTQDDLIEAWSSLGQSYLVGKSKKGAAIGKGGARRIFADVLKAGMGGAMNSETQFFNAVWRRAAKLSKLKREGKLGEDLTAELERQLGIDSQAAHEAAVADGVASEIASYSEENPGPNGETFSLSEMPKNEVAAKDAFESAVKRFGLTRDIAEAGYILPDGRLLDFTGRADAGYVRRGDFYYPETGRDWMKGQRGTDHREVEWEGMPPYKETWMPMVEFMRMGAVRIDKSGAITIHGRQGITAAQKSRLADLLVESDGSFYLDMEDDTGKRGSVSGDGAKIGKVAGFIQKWKDGWTPDAAIETFSLRKFPVPPGLAEAAQKARGESSLILAYQAAQRGSSSAMVPIRSVYEQAKKYQPALTPAQFMEQINALNDSGKILVGLSETMKAVEAAGEFRVGGAGTEMAIPQETFSVRVTPAQDAAYLAAVEAGDMETAQRMVDEAAKKAGLVKLTFLEDSVPSGYYRPTTHKLSSLRMMEDATRKSERGEWDEFLEWVNGDVPLDMEPIVTTEYEDEPEVFHVNDGNHRVRAWQNEFDMPGSTIIPALTYTDSLDLVFEDEAGNVIPLSQRFNPADNRITYSLRSGDFSSRMAAAFSPFQRSPELRRLMGKLAHDRVMRLAADLIDKANVIRKTSDLEREARTREAVKADELTKSGMKEADARKEAKRQVSEWLANARKESGSAKAQRDRLKAWLRTLDAILSAAPAEVRAKVGGYIKLAGLATDEAMLKEIENRIAKLDVELSKWLKKEYLEQITKLFKRFAPKKDDKGRITSSITAEAAEDIGFAFEFASLDDANQEKEMAALEKTLEESEDAAEIQDAIGKLAIANLFHKLEEREASELEAAALWLEELGSGAREARKIIDAARAEWVKEAKDAAKADAANGRLSSLPDAENVEADARSSTFKRFTNDVKGFLNSALFTIGQQLELVFGQDSRITTEFHRRAVRAANDSTDIKRDIETRRADFVAKLFGTTSRIKQAGRMGALTVPTASGVVIATGGKTKIVDVPAEIIERIVEGTADLKALGLTTAEAATLADAWADSKALPANRRKRVFQVERQSKGKDVELKMSQDDAIQYLLWSKQKASREQMERDGWSKESFEQLDAFLSDDARALAGFFADEYARIGRLIEPVYRRMFHAPFPQVRNYSPIFRDISGADSIIDIDQQGHGSGVSSGFILARNKNARSAMRRTSAISAFMQHAQSAAHWISHVELVRDLRSVLTDKEVQNAIRSSGRTAAANGIKKRVMQLENQGKVGAAGIAELDSWGSRLLQAHAFKGLAWRISPVMKQTSAFFNPLLADVPAWDYMRGTARLLSGELNVTAMWQRPEIQRRIIGGFSAEARIAMDRLGYTGSTMLAAMGKGMMPMALVDAAWTTAGAAIAFDYYRRNNIKSGMNETQAESAALDQIEMMIAESAQPADPANRSLIEGLQNPWLKSMWMFASESRKNLAVEIMALRRLATGKSKNKALDLQRAVVAHVVMGATTQLMAGILSLLMGDDDDKEREWSVEEWASAIVAGPINGLFLFGDAFNYIGRRLFGLHAFEPSTAIGQAIKTVSYAPDNLDKVINGDPEEQRKAFLRLSEAVGQAAALVGPGNPFTAADVILGNPLRYLAKALGD